MPRFSRSAASRPFSWLSAGGRLASAAAVLCLLAPAPRAPAATAGPARGALTLEPSVFDGWFDALPALTLPPTATPLIFPGPTGGAASTHPIRLDQLASLGRATNSAASPGERTTQAYPSTQAASAPGDAISWTDNNQDPVFLLSAAAQAPTASADPVFQRWADAGFASVDHAGVTPRIVSYGTYTNIADTTMTAPGQTTKFFGFILSPTISGSNVAFMANYNNSSSYAGIYTGTAGTIGATRIADYSTIAPGQTSAFTQFEYPVISNGNVAFLGNYSGGGGLYLYTSGATTPLARIADFSTVPTGQTNAFSNFGIPAISGGTVAFLGGTATVQGIYTGTASGGVTRLYDTTMNAPGRTLPLNNFDDPVISGSNVAFEGYNYSGGKTNFIGIYTGKAGTSGISTLADSSTVLPGQSTAIANLYGCVISGDNVAFDAITSTGGGIYTGSVSTRTLTRIVDSTTSVPGQTGTFYNFANYGISGGTVAFLGYYNSGRGQGIYTGAVSTPGVVTRIADFSTLAPGQTTAFNNFGAFSVSGSNVAFLGIYNSGNSTGIFLSRSGSLLDIAETGESLFGSTISYLTFSSSGLDGNDLTFYYTLANNVSGIATVVVPEPATWLAGALLVGGAAWSLARRRLRNA